MDHLVFVSFLIRRPHLSDDTIVSGGIDEPIDVYSLAELVGNVDTILLVDGDRGRVEK